MKQYIYKRLDTAFSIQMKGVLTSEIFKFSPSSVHSTDFHANIKNGSQAQSLFPNLPFCANLSSCRTESYI